MVKNIIIALIVLALIVWGFSYFRNDEDTVITPAVSTSSVPGCYVSKLNKDVYTLKIDSVQGENATGTLKYNNFEKDSSSGTFSGTFKGNILLGIYSFDSEGMHSERQVIFKKDGENFIQGFGPVTVVNNVETFSDLGNITYNPDLNNFAKSPTCDDSITYTEAAGNFSFTYDSDFVAMNGDKKPTKDWTINSVNTGVVLATLTIPKSYMPNTNFSEAKLTIGRSSDAVAIKNCAAIPANSAGKDAGNATIAGYPFKKMTFSDAGAGNFYDTTSYRGILDGDCYVIEYTIHSTNIQNYPAEQGIKEFDKTKIEAEMEKIISSLHFQLASD
jgi:hypothetical protein